MRHERSAEDLGRASWPDARSSAGRSVSKIAETTADDEGAWTIVLEKPLATGDHSLALRATSQEGTQALTAKAPVPVAVAQKEPTAPQPPKPEQQAEVPPQGVEGQPTPSLSSQPQPVVTPKRQRLRLLI